jgi:2-keto-4-pentenoate hydratase/2-oxohepta-3-ene-1,7-dioic acid hydratase in catechol pathway
MTSQAFVRFRKDGQWRWGRLSGDRVVPVRGGLFRRQAAEDPSCKLANVVTGSPCRPSKIIAVGINYRSHALEMGHELPPVPKLFLKAPSAALSHGGAIVLPAQSRRVDYEGELAVVMGKKTKHISPERAIDHVFGYTCFNDVTARDLQRLDGQWARAKSFDTFAPFGPAVVTGLDPSRLRVESFVNGRKRQSAPVSDLIFPVPSLVSFISEVMTLLPGDVIATGTPSGVGPLKEGDTVEVRIKGVGSLVNTVRRA